MALGRSDTTPRALGCVGGRDERLPKTYSEGAVTRNARVLREVLFTYEVVLSRQHVAFECVRSEVQLFAALQVYRITCTVSPLSDPEGRQDR